MDMDICTVPSRLCVACVAVLYFLLLGGCSHHGFSAIVGDQRQKIRVVSNIHCTVQYIIAVATGLLLLLKDAQEQEQEQACDTTSQLCV